MRPISFFILNILTARYQFHELGITLWSPDNGLSVLLLIQGTQFAPFVLLGEVMVDVFINRVHHSIYVIFLAELALTLGYAVFAAVLRDILKFSPRRANLADVISILSAVPVGAAITALIYLSCPRFLWTAICQRGDRGDEGHETRN